MADLNPAPARWSPPERASLTVALAAILTMIAGAAGVPVASVAFDAAQVSIVDVWASVVDAIRAGATVLAHLIGA